MKNSVINFAKEPLNFILVYFFLVAFIDIRFIPVTEFKQDAVLIFALVLPITSFLFLTKFDLREAFSKALNGPSLLIVVFLIWSLIALPFSHNKLVSSFYILGGSAVFYSGFVLVKERIDQIWFKKMLLVISTVGVVAAVFSSIFIFLGQVFPNFSSVFLSVDVNLGVISIKDVPVLESYYQHPNTFALLLFYSLVATIALALLTKGKRTHRFIIASFCILLVSLVLTFSRTSVIGASIFSLLISPIAFRKKNYLPLVSLFLLVLSFMVITFASLYIGESAAVALAQGEGEKQVVINSDSSVRQQLSKSTLSNRQRLWESSINIIKQNPIFGVGLGNSVKALEQDLPEISSRYRGLSSHNTYLRVAVESGIVGLAIYLSLLASLGILFLKKLKKLRTLHWVILAFIISMLSIQLVETTFLLGTAFRSFYFLAILASGFSLLQRA